MMVNAGSQTQKATCCMSPFVGSVQNEYNHRDRKHTDRCQGLGRMDNGAGRAEGSGEQLLNGNRVPFGVVTKFSK